MICSVCKERKDWDAFGLSITKGEDKVCKDCAYKAQQLRAAVWREQEERRKQDLTDAFRKSYRKRVNHE
jgi:hypothetical protein